MYRTRIIERSGLGACFVLYTKVSGSIPGGGALFPKLCPTSLTQKG